MESDKKQEEYVLERKGLPLIVKSFIVCVASLPLKRIKEGKSLSYLVLGTETNGIYVVDLLASKIVDKFRLPDTPFKISVFGSYESDFKIVVATRNGTIFFVNKQGVQF